MCGICAIVSRRCTNIHEALQKLRHRGFDSWGIAKQSSNHITVHRSTQRVVRPDANASTPEEIHFEIAHTRYTTRGTHTELDQVQPLLTEDNRIALVHNGQVNYNSELYSTDSAYLLDVVATELSRMQGFAPDVQVELAFYKIFGRLNGSYACVALVTGVGMIAFRDPHGIRPLICGMTDDGTIAFASESCALSADYTTRLDVLPGQVWWIDCAGKLSIFRPLPDAWLPKPQLCLFEIIYLAHNDSVIDGLSVQFAREQLGRALTDQITAYPHRIDCIIPVPHTPLIAAKELSRETDIDVIHLLQIISRATRRESRTFILPTTSARETAVRLKFAINEDLIPQCKGRNLLLLDDSIVRGTTLRHVVQLVREKVRPANIFVASLAPPIISPNRFGIDIPDTDQLIATTHDGNIPEKVAYELNVDGPVIYQTLRRIKEIFQRDFEDSVFRPQPRSIKEQLADQW